ncbi:MAG: DUF3052 family protein [Pseudomonadota bacterium]
MTPGSRVRPHNAPEDYADLLAPIPEGVQFSARFRQEIDLWHLFTRQRRELERLLPKAMEQIRRDGMIWVSWPKRASGVATDVTEDVVREVALPMGLVDVKVCAVDATWSGLKLVILKALR